MERQFDRRMESLASIGKFLEETVAEYRLDDATSYLLNLIVEELFTNIVKYGKPSSVPVPIVIIKDAHRMVVRIIDHEASSFDPTKAPEPDTDAPLERRKVGGLGIHIVRQMVDALEYVNNGTSSEIIAIKNLES